jgi:thiol-disulfide isomerase/thioredoxin
MRRRVVMLLAALSMLSGWGKPVPPTVGSPAPDFTARALLGGDKIELSKQHDKVVFLTFWASWCAPCRHELPVLEAVQQKLGKDRALVLAVNFKESPDNVAVIARRLRAKGSQMTIAADANGLIAARYAVDAIPHLFIIGRDGKILADHRGYSSDSLDSLIADINAAMKDSGESNEAVATLPPANAAEP